MDREKVIEGLKAMREFFGFGLPSQAPVFEAYQNILTDTIAMLKEQEAEATIFYRCDPEKNKECKKRGCKKESNAFRCSCTSYPDYAVRDDKGNPIIAYIHFEDKGTLIANGGADW